MTVLGLLVHAGHVFDFLLAVCNVLKIAEKLELVRLKFPQIKQIEFLNRIISVSSYTTEDDLLTLPRSRSHMRLEMGRSISLLSTILLAINVPASLNSDCISFTLVDSRFFTSMGLGNKLPSAALLRHIFPSSASPITCASLEKNS